MSSRETAKARPSADHAAASGRKRVAIVTLHPRHGGGILSMMQWGYELFRKLGYDPVLHFLSDQPPDNLSWRRLNFRARTSRTTWLGMNAVRIGMRHSFIEYGNYRFNLDLWKRALEGFDLYFAITGGAHHALPLALLDKPFGMWVATAHSDDVESRLRSKSLVPGWLRRYETKSLERDEARVMAKAKQILALSEHTREKLAKVYPPARDRMLIAPFPVDIERFRPGERSKESGDYIMAVGRFSDARKNIELLIRAFDLVARRHPDLELWLAGEPPEPRFRQLGEDLGLGNRIRYLGEMAPRTVGAAIPGCEGRGPVFLARGVGNRRPGVNGMWNARDQYSVRRSGRHHPRRGRRVPGAAERREGAGRKAGGGLG